MFYILIASNLYTTINLFKFITCLSILLSNSTHIGKKGMIRIFKQVHDS